MNGVLVEEIVKREWKGKEYFKCVAFTLGFAVLYLVIMYVLNLFQLSSYLGPALLAGACWLSFIMISNMRLEFEYSISDGYMVVDKIIAKRNRKRVAAFDIKEIESLLPFEDSFLQKHYDTVCWADENKEDAPKWCIEFTGRDTGHTLVIFSPSERVMTAVKPYLRKQVAFHAFG